MSQDRSSIVVLGIGNELLRDEGAGVVAARVLMQDKLPPGVRVVDAGTGGLDLLFEMEGADVAIIIDAADMGLEPGAVRVFSPEEADIELMQNMASLHQIGLADVLQIGGLTGPMPEVRIIGIQPEEIAPGTGLSVKVGQVIGDVAARAREVIAQFTECPQSGERRQAPG